MLMEGNPKNQILMQGNLTNQLLMEGNLKNQMLMEGNLCPFKEAEPGRDSFPHVAPPDILGKQHPHRRIFRHPP